MSLTEKQRRHLEKLELSQGGGFYNFATNVNRADMLNDKFLFVGLGGKGCRTLAAIKTGIARKVKLDEDKDKPDNVEYLAIDTAIEDLGVLSRKSMDNVGLDLLLETCQLYSDTAAGVLKGGQIPDYIERWKNPALRALLTGRGANGIRQASRILLSFDDGFNRVKKTLASKIAQLCAVNHGKGQLIVYVLAGISGGTGSGIFIDIPYIIRQVCRDAALPDVKIEGYIFLPDSYPVEIDAPYLKSNAYAALKELDFYMNVANGEDTYFDATYAGGYTVHSRENIFNTCTLISGSIQGLGRRPDPDKFSQQVVVDHIVNLVTKSEVGADQYLITSFLDNDETMISGCVKTLPNTVPRNALYKYNVIGIGAVTLPIEQIFSYISKKAFDQIVEIWSKKPMSADVERLIQSLRVYPSAQYSDILSVSKVGLMTYQKKMLSPTREAVINGTAFAQVKSLWMARNVELGISLDSACNEVLQGIVNRFNHALQEMFEDPDRGLFYTVDFLGYVAADTNEMNGLLQRLKTDIYNQTNGLINGARAAQTDIRNQMSMIENYLGRTPALIPVGGKIQDYVEYAVRYVVEESRIDIYQRIQGKLDEFTEHVEKKLEVYRCYADNFWGIKNVFEENFGCVMAGKIETQEYRVNLIDMSRKDDDTRRFVTFLDGLLDKANYRSMVVNLAKKIEANGKLLLNEEYYNPMGLYTQFIEEEFSQIPNTTIDKIIEIKYGKGGFNEGVKNIFDDLEISSKVIFDPLPQFPMGSMSSMGYISVPKKAVDLVSQIKKCADMKGIKVAESSDMNSIIWYNLICGVPLFSVGRIAEYEKEYENPSMREGMHLSETGERDWGKFPNLFKQQLWGTCAYENPREKKIIDEVSNDTELMLKWGIIQQRTSVGGTVDYEGRRLLSEVSAEDIEKFMVEYCADSFNLDEKGNVRTGSYLFEKFCDRFGVKPVRIFFPNVYDERSLNGLKRMMRLNWTAYLDLKKMMDVYPKLEEAVVTKNKLGTFHSMMITEKIKEEDGFYIYTSTTGREIELLFTEDLHGIQHDHELFYVFERFQKILHDDEISDMMIEVAELKRERSRIAVLKAHKEELGRICEEKINMLNQARVRRQYEQAGFAKLYDELFDFYSRLKSLN